MADARGTLIVTGSGRGIGAATARLAAREGYAVCVNYHSQSDPAERLAEEIRATGGRAVAVQADTSVPSDVERLFATAGEQLGPLTALVNNAGISGGRSRLVDTDIETLKRVLDVNVVGYFLCAQQAVRRMAESGNGKAGGIVNVSSQAAQFGGNQLAHYAASKAAVNAFTIGLAREVAAQGIRVNAVSPGIIDSGQQDPAETEKLGRSVPIGRVGAPAEVAEAILWLLSDRASYVTGAILPVAGGR